MSDCLVEKDVKESADNMPRPSPLRTEAEDILHGLGLLPYLGQFGEAAVVGSVALDLIVRLDIDVAVLAVGRDLFRIAAGTTRYLFDMAGVKEVRLSDCRAQGGLKLGIDAWPGRSGLWSVGIWITDRRDTTGFDALARWLRELTPEHREAILAIKREWHKMGQLRDGASALIYDAVLNGGIRTPEQFRAWRESIEGK